MFSTLHLIWLFICTALIIVGAIVAIKKEITLEFALTLLCIFCLTSEVVKVFCVLIREERVVEGKGVFIKETDLPFHLCSLQIIFSFVAKFTKNEKIRAFLLTFMMPTCFLGKQNKQRKCSRDKPGRQPCEYPYPVVVLLAHEHPADGEHGVSHSVEYYKG